MGLRPWDERSKSDPGCPEEGTKKTVLVSPNPGRERYLGGPPASPRFRLSKCAALQVSRPRHPPPRPNRTDLPLAGEEGGRLACGSRDPWSWGVQVSPSSHHSSSAVLLGLRRAPYNPSQGERPAATPGSLHFASALLRGRRSASTKGRWSGRAGYTASLPSGGWGTRTGDRGAELTRPQSLLARALGPDWLAARGKRDLGQTGWHPSHQK